MEGQKTPYSYHTFMFPFLIHTKEKFFHEEHWQQEKIFETTFSELRQEELYWRYAAFEYFTETARQILFGEGTKKFPVKRYHFAPNEKNIRGKFTYIIEKEGMGLFKLVVNDIQLLLFGDDMGLLTFELENREHDQRNLAAVNCINDYGRRVNLAYLSNARDENTNRIIHPITADSIKLQSNGLVDCDCHYQPQDFLGKLASSFDDDGLSTNPAYVRGTLKMRYTAPHVRDLLSYPNDPNTRKLGPEDISPIIDDRMFVCCIVCDEKFGDECRQYDMSGASCLQSELQPHAGRGNYHYLTSCDYGDSDTNTSCKLYRLLFVEKDTSCQSRTMRRKLLERCIYDRWIDYGTLHGVSHHAIICVTGSPAKYPPIQASVINPFLTIYTEIAKIVLLQRACILSLSNQVSSLAQLFYAESQKKQNSLNEIQSLQERFVQLQSSLFLSEITTAEQGIEIYQMLENEMYVTENSKKLDAQLHNLYELANLQGEQAEENRARKLERAVAAFGIPALFLTIVQTLYPMFFDRKLHGTAPWIWSSCLAGLCIAATCYLLVTLCRKSLKKQKSNQGYFRKTKTL